MKKQKRQVAGFTLLGLAIVLVMIGLLLGGILTSKEMITQARIKKVVNGFNGTTAAYFSYWNRYRAAPGNDPNAATRWASFGTPAGNGDGSLGGAYGSSRRRVPKILVASAGGGVRSWPDPQPGGRRPAQ
jgi:hypothetical protein